MTTPRPQTDDLQTANNLKRIDDLECFKKEYEGKEFDKKVLLSIQESHSIREELEKINWNTIKNKIVWIITGFLGLVLTDLTLRAIPHLFSLFK
ncbi:MAG TPA: hypothetical protein VMC41_02905 [Candidatus Nanoarchaeia archaeon]|nr:hypothetical protein [Candidatus Nanoarchaeia archaeon]